MDRIIQLIINLGGISDWKLWDICKEENLSYNEICKELKPKEMYGLATGSLWEKGWTI